MDVSTYPPCLFVPFSSCTAADGFLYRTFKSSTRNSKPCSPSETHSQTALVDQVIQTQSKLFSTLDPPQSLTYPPPLTHVLTHLGCALGAGCSGRPRLLPQGCGQLRRQRRTHRRVLRLRFSTRQMLADRQYLSSSHKLLVSDD